MSSKTHKDALHAAFNVERGRAKYSTIRERVITSAKIDGIHLCQLIASMTIASIGLNIDSTEAVIGAMLICPLMGSVLAMALALATMDMGLFKRASAGMLLQCVICLVTSTLYFWASPLSVETSELLANSSPTIWDLMIALVGGFAGALGLSRRNEPSTLVAGVAVATALMPPLCAVGYGIANGGAALAGAAFYEFLINLLFIASGSAFVFVWLRMPLVGDLDGDGKEDAAEKAEAERESHPLRHSLVLALVMFAIPCIGFSFEVVRDAREQSAMEHMEQSVVDSYETEEVTKELEILCPGFVSYRVNAENAYQEEDDAVVQRLVATVTTSEAVEEERVDDIDALIRLHVPAVDEVVFEVSEE